MPFCEACTGGGRSFLIDGHPPHGVMQCSCRSIRACFPELRAYSRPTIPLLPWSPVRWLVAQFHLNCVLASSQRACRASKTENMTTAKEKKKMPKERQTKNPAFPHRPSKRGGGGGGGGAGPRRVLSPLVVQRGNETPAGQV